MTVESPQDMSGLLAIGRVVGLTLRHLEEQLRPGMTTAELDHLAEQFLHQHGARSAPVLTYNFPGTTCISINEVAAHGIPGDQMIRAGDLVKLDVSAERDDYFADAAVTVLVPPIAPSAVRLRDCAQAALEGAIRVARAGAPLSQIGRTAGQIARRCGFQVIRELPGHGIGRALHENPTVPQYQEPRARGRLTEGLVITIEPHVAARSGQIVQEADGWTLRTRDRSLVAQFEHTIVVTAGRPIIVTAV